MEFHCLSVSRDTHTSYPDFFKHVDECAMLYDDAVVLLNQRSVKTDEFGELQGVVIFNFMKATESLIALAQLCDSGFIPDARTVCRKLIDQAVSIAYLSQDIPNRLPLYKNFGALKLHSLLREFDRIGLRHFSEYFADGFDRLRPDITKAYQAAKSIYPTTDSGKIKDSYEWSGRRFNEMAVATGLERTIVPHKLFSLDTHSSIMNQRTYRSSNGLEYKSPLHQEQIDEVPYLLMEGCKDYLVVATQANEPLSLGMFNRVCELDHGCEVLLDRLSKDE